VAKSQQAIHFVSSTPLKFGTVGFPQYGFSLRCVIPAAG